METVTCSGGGDKTVAWKSLVRLVEFVYWQRTRVDVVGLSAIDDRLVDGK